MPPCCWMETVQFYFQDEGLDCTGAGEDWVSGLLSETFQQDMLLDWSYVRFGPIWFCPSFATGKVNLWPCNRPTMTCIVHLLFRPGFDVMQMQKDSRFPGSRCKVAPVELFGQKIVPQPFYCDPETYTEGQAFGNGV